MMCSSHDYLYWLRIKTAISYTLLKISYSFFSLRLCHRIHTVPHQNKSSIANNYINTNLNYVFQITLNLYFNLSILKKKILVQS